MPESDPMGNMMINQMSITELTLNISIAIFAKGKLNKDISRED